MSKVALTKCNRYESGEVDSAVFSAIDLAGGIAIKAGDVILVKANLVAPQKPEAMATTHPSVVAAVCEYVRAKGGMPIIGDSPGAMYNKARLSAVYQATGMAELSKRLGIKLNDNFNSRSVMYDAGVALKRFDVIEVAETVDGIINVAKYKTHTFTGISGATKNMFGIIPGLKKVELHGTHTELSKFCDLLIDIQEFYKPKMLMHVVDAVTGMEGEGPTGGKPRDIGRIIASVSPYEADVVGIRITRNELEKIPMMTRAIERGLVSLNDIEVVGCTVEESVVENYDNVKLVSNQPLNKLPPWLQGMLFKLCSQRPRMPKSKCRGCGKCFEHCPPKAIHIKNGRAMVDLNKCIRCFCCQELCPFHIVKIKTPLLSKVFHKLS